MHDLYNDTHNEHHTIVLSANFDCLRQKTRVHGLSYGVVCVILGLAVLVQHRRVTDRRTEGRTHDDSKYCDSIASRR